jgi:hypothetical protein
MAAAELAKKQVVAKDISLTNVAVSSKLLRKRLEQTRRKLIKTLKRLK